MMMAIVGCLWALRRGRQVLAGALLLTSVLLKEFAYPMVLAIFALSLLRSRKEAGTRLWPASLNRFQTIAALASIIGLWPLLLALSMGAPFPGGFHGGTWEEIPDRAFLSVWLIPLVLLGLAFARTRHLSILALLYPALFLGYRLLGHSVAYQYFLPPSLLAVVAASLTLDESWTVAKARWKGPGALGVPAVAVALGLVQVFNASAPFAMADKASWTAPFTGAPDASLREVQNWRFPESVLYWEAVDTVVSGGWRTVLELDGPYFNHFYPLPQHVDAYRSAHTRWADVDESYLGRVVKIMENMTEVTVLRMGPGPANRALQVVYEDCVRFRNDFFLVIEGPACGGRLERVLEADASFRSGGSARSRVGGQGPGGCLPPTRTGRLIPRAASGSRILRAAAPRARCSGLHRRSRSSDSCGWSSPRKWREARH